LEGLSTIAEEEIDPLASKVQLATAAAWEQISASANDNQQAGGHAQLVRSIIVDGDNEPQNHEEYLDATDGTTVVTTTQVAKDVWHTDMIEWGTGGKDCAGNVDVRTIADVVISQIVAGANEGQGSGFMIPDGWLCSLLGGRLEAVGAHGAGQGTTFTMRVEDVIDAATTVQVLTDYIWQVTDTHRSQELEPSIKIFQSGTEITFHQIYIVAAEDFSVRMYFLLWKK